MPKFNDLTGQTFFRITIIDRAANSNKKTMWNCICICGKKTIVDSYSLTTGKTKSCGCYRNELTSKRQKQFGRPLEYEVWSSAKSRCHCVTNIAYKNYGGRGITMCARWRNSFPDFMADMGQRPSPELTLERKNNSKGYCKTNCYWATRESQSRNTRRTHNITYQGKTQCLKDWANELGINYQTLHTRVMKQKLPTHIAFTKPTVRA